MRYVPYTKETVPQATEAGHASRASIAKSFGLSYSKFGGSYRSESQAGALRQFPSLAAMASGPIRSTADRAGEVQEPNISAQGSTRALARRASWEVAGVAGWLGVFLDRPWKSRGPDASGVLPPLAVSIVAAKPGN